MIFSCTDSSEDLTIHKNGVRSESLGTPINDFGYNLFSILANCNDNTILSPLSIHCALAMASNAVDSASLDEMKKVMHINEMADYNQAYSELLTSIAAFDNANLSINNSIFYDSQRLNLNQDFYAILRKNYSCEKIESDFGDPSAPMIINQWVTQKTNNKIKELIEKINNESAFIINTIYFKDDWAEGFDKNHTRKSIFYNEDNSQAEVNMMYTRNAIESFMSSDFDAIDLPMKNEHYSFTAIVPKSKTLTEFISDLSTKQSFTQWLNDNVLQKLQTTDLNLILPKFKLETTYSLNKSLMMIGMNKFIGSGLPNLSSPSAFNPIGNITHKTFFDLNESGIEGAAVTSIGIVAETTPYNINFDRPFLFVLRNSDTNLPLFIGKVSKM